MKCSVDDVKSVIRNIYASCPVEVLSEEEKLSAYGFDSVRTIMLIVALEEKFQFEWADEELLLENLETVNDIVMSVNRQLNKNYR